jgi:hypothetical protein
LFASLEAVDSALAYTASPGTAPLDSLPLNAAAGEKMAAQIELTRERMLFWMESRLSYVSDAFAAEAAEFWRGK